MLHHRPSTIMACTFAHAVSSVTVRLTFPTIDTDCSLLSGIRTMLSEPYARLLHVP